MYILLLFIKYIYHRLCSKSSKGYGIHSPFAFSFVCKVFNKKENASEIKRIRSIHKSFQKEPLPVTKNDPGAGTRGRVLKRIFTPRAGSIGVSFKYGRLLFNLTRYVCPHEIIELGTGTGISLLYFIAAGGDVPVCSVEGNPDRKNMAEKRIREVYPDRKNLYIHCKDFTDFLKNHRFGNHPVLVFVDGNHQYKPTMEYFRFLLTKVAKDSVLVFDDIRWSADMEKAWKEIIKHEEVSLSIDLFSMGIVFLKKNMAKQNLRINF